MPGASTLQRYDVVSHALTTVFDVASRPDLFGTNRYIWQFHSSDDDCVHSATLKDGSTYADLGCRCIREDTKQFGNFPQKGLRYDECQIDKSGRWLVIKEEDSVPIRRPRLTIASLTCNCVERKWPDWKMCLEEYSDTGFGDPVAL